MSDFLNNKTQKADDSPPPHENLQIVQLRLLSEQGEAVKEKKLGWVQRGTKYCQLVRELSRVKCLEFAAKCIDRDSFDNNIYTADVQCIGKTTPSCAFVASSHMGWYFKEGGTNIVNMDATFHTEHILKKTSPHQSSWAATVSSRTMILSTHAG